MSGKIPFHVVQVSRSDLRDLLLQCCADEAPDVRQSALALLGDLVKVLILYLSIVYVTWEHIKWSSIKRCKLSGM